MGRDGIDGEVGHGNASISSTAARRAGVERSADGGLGVFGDVARFHSRLAEFPLRGHLRLLLALRQLAGDPHLVHVARVTSVVSGMENRA